MTGQVPHITYKKHTFLSSVAMGFSAVIITILVCCTTVLLYTVHLAGEKSERLVTLAEGAIRGLPEFSKSLPPVLSDMLNDHRQPDYAGHLAISTKVLPRTGHHSFARMAIEITNNGQEVVSLLSLRIILLDENGQLHCESQEWAATPVATDGEWRGPIMPGSRRYFIAQHTCDNDSAEALHTEVEITELRVWNGSTKAPADAEQTTTPVAAVQSY
ncbi:MAG: hypothetical protein JW955_09290 [Sedimentisphaerales bacterium]|nr:hypothetical protein [Sedimentisphaerales bacterium]